MPRHFKKEACNTCRHRKVKCDETYPICQRCSSSRRYCDRSERPPQQTYRAPSEKIPDQSPRKALESSLLAGLLRHYINDVALWYDLSDARCSFSREVPILALDNPLLFNAIIALSAMHMSQTTAPSARATAELYHTQCVRLLIDLDPRDPSIPRGVALAATCLLRSYEILAEDRDPNRHLRGAFSLASQVEQFPSQAFTGLLRSGFWNYLREDITFSLFSSCQLKINLDTFTGVTAPSSDEDHLDAISLVLGRVINGTLGGTSEITDDDWEALLMQVKDWHLNLPAHIAPFSRAQISSLFRLPSIQMLADCHAGAYHYCLVCLALLALCSPSPAHLEAVRDIASSTGMSLSEVKGEKDLLELFALEICGIAFTSNKPSVLVNAFGPMTYCAKYIRHESTQQEIVSHLVAAQKSTGWSANHIVPGLRKQWDMNKQATGNEDKQIGLPC